MFNENSLRAVRSSLSPQGFVVPAYGSYCFAGIPGFVRGLFGDSSVDPSLTLPQDVLGAMDTDYDAVVLLFVDAFGWKFCERYLDHPVLKQFLDQGMVSVITSQFPSTTAAHVPTISTGVPVYESGVMEWHYYEPRVGEVIGPLLYNYPGDAVRNTLTTDPVELFGTETLYRRLGGLGVQSAIFQFSGYTPSPFSDVAFQGAEVHPYQRYEAGFDELVHTVRAAEEPLYCFCYFDGIDDASHFHGPESQETAASIEQFLQQLETRLVVPLRETGKKTLLLLTADHGQIKAQARHPHAVLNRAMPQLESFMRRSRSGKPLVAPTARDLFLHVAESHLAEAKSEIERLVEDAAWVLTREEAFSAGLFGPRPSARLAERMGSLVVLPKDGELFTWDWPGYTPKPFLGFHGGVSRDEMESVFLALAC